MSTATLNAEREIDLRLVMARLAARRSWIIVSTLLFAAGFITAAFLMTPIYRGTTVLIAANTDKNGMGSLGSALGQLGGLASLAGVNLGSTDAETQEALAVLQSREFTEKFIRDENLMPLLFASRWDPAAKQWRGEKEDWPTSAQGFKYFDAKVRTVNRDKLTGLVTMDIEWRDPVTAARWANRLVERLNDEMRARAIAATNASVGYLEKELASTSTIETRQAINRLMEAQINQRMLANVTKEYAFRVVDRALPPDPRDKVRPNKVLMVVLGPALGLLFGAFAALVAGAFTSPRAER